MSIADICTIIAVGTIALAIVVGLPALICWTALVLATRALVERPSEKRVVVDVILTGLMLELFWMLLMTPVALAVMVVLLAAVALAGPGAVGGPPSPLAIGMTAVVIAGISLIGFRPILVEEWRRLTA